MEKLLWIDDDEQFDKYHRGCMSGIFQALDYLSWQSNSKKMLPDPKHDELKHAKRNRRQKIGRHEHVSFEMQKLLDAEVDQSSEKTTPTHERSLKARLKSLISENNAKEYDHEQKIPPFPASSRLRRTYSIHHAELEISGFGKSKISKGWGRPLKLLHDGGTKTEDHKQEKSVKSTDKATEAENLGNRISDDVLDIFQVNKELFLNILQDESGQRGSNRRTRLTKSGSFPYLPREKNFKPSKLEHKTVEFYPPAKEEKLRLVTSKSGPLVAGYAGNRHLSHLGSIHERYKQGEYDLVLPSKSLRERVEDEMERKLESDCNENCGSVSNRKRGSFSHIRSISLTEPAERSAPLYSTRSLSMSDENSTRSTSHASSLFGRIKSLHHLDSIQESVDSNSVSATSKPLENIIDIESDGLCADKYEEIGSKEGDGNLTSAVETSCADDQCSRISRFDSDDATATGMVELAEEMNGLTVEKNSYQNEQSETSTDIASNVLPRPSPVLYHDIAELQTLEGSGCTGNYSEKDESTVIQLNVYNGDVDPRSFGPVSPENFKSGESYTCIEQDTEKDADFLYVKEILERSGFISKGFQQTWYSSNQPLDPSLFEELESCYPCKPECFEEEMKALTRHLLLFDLVNEALLQTYQNCFTYYPKALSSSCHVSLAPMISHMLEEIWGRVLRSLRLKSEVKECLDSVVSGDMGKDDGWMNLQVESECMALEFEDLIFDELLEDAIADEDRF